MCSFRGILSTVVGSCGFHLDEVVVVGGGIGVRACKAYRAGDFARCGKCGIWSGG